jgi:hypothetical protein
MDRLHGKLVCLSKPVKVTDNSKDTNLLHELSIFRTLQIRNVLYDRTQGWYSQNYYPSLFGHGSLILKMSQAKLQSH